MRDCCFIVVVFSVHTVAQVVDEAAAKGWLVCLGSLARFSRLLLLFLPCTVTVGFVLLLLGLLFIVLVVVPTIVESGLWGVLLQLMLLGIVWLWLLLACLAGRMFVADVAADVDAAMLSVLHCMGSSGGRCSAGRCTTCLLTSICVEEGAAATVLIAVGLAAALM